MVVSFNAPDCPAHSLIWDTVKQSRIVELGGDRADYALKAGCFVVSFFGFCWGVKSITGMMQPSGISHLMI